MNISYILFIHLFLFYVGVNVIHSIVCYELQAIR